jgi:hypothetical protein
MLLFDFRIAMRTNVFLLAAVMSVTATQAQTSSTFAQLDSPNTASGYLARLLINEVPFPGERAYESETATKEAMVQILWVLHGRLTLVPAGYTQQQIAGVKAKSIIDVITGTGERRQCEGFYKNSAGQFVTDDRVEERLDYLLKIANKGNKPGRFSELLNFGQGLARAYVTGGIEEADRFANIKWVKSVAVTGRAYSWMTDVNNYHPGGNFVSIPNDMEGSLGGNRFFTLRKEPK